MQNNKLDKFPVTDVRSQEEVFAFLRRPSSYQAPPDYVEVHETHGAVVFLAGNLAYKVKKDVKLPYMDFSTLEKRHYYCQHELDINRPYAPGLYIDILPITIETNGSLALNGKGSPIEWAIRMKRFDQEKMLDHLPHAKLAEKPLIEKLTTAILRYHRLAPSVVISDGPQKISALIEELALAFWAAPEIFSTGQAAEFETLARENLDRTYYCLRWRGRRGFVRRCHGDLHLRNIVMIDDEPLPFDALEFDEDLATIDVLYDLAFLLMDLDYQGLSPTANRILNKYLFLSSKYEDIYGLKAMPLFLALRAGIRAMVCVDHARQCTGKKAGAKTREAGIYFHAALHYLRPKKPLLIAIGGFSGTGKTTLAERLAGSLDHAPGFLHLRSDTERKQIFDVAETDRLGSKGYTKTADTQVYDHLLRKARITLKVGQRVIVDAVFSKEHERRAFETLAKEFDIPFIGLWLTADEAQMSLRVVLRRGDASDATPDIVHQQLRSDTGSNNWLPVDASGTEIDTLKNTLAVFESAAFDLDQCIDI
ncbi:MAG: AAA family ATPase [Sneathiella sp.]|uniref:bifunctional aminoglycoside phosphotransferase/ATP-binding protein n=1 Tax=Sneathiella sp. TaxID=1964365 RepID=UPI0030033C55